MPPHNEQQALRELIQLLSPRPTARQMARELGVSTDRLRTIERQAIKKLRQEAERMGFEI